KDLKCHILLGNSPQVLLNLVPNLKGNTLWFLDAHFPGADFKKKKYKNDSKIALPLEDELDVIKSLRDIQSDIFIIDDIRIYKKDKWELGNLSDEEGHFIGTDFIEEIFVNEKGFRTHNTLIYLNYSGFMTAFPTILWSENSEAKNK
ncbi:MAG: hypothetical protein ACW96X_05315, partial [Promethearchaeota archaeon]